MNVPVFLNLEHSHQDPDILARYVRRATICQASTDPEQKYSSHARGVAQKLLDAGAQTALITLAGEGCWAVNRGETLRVHAPRVPVVDGCGAGATFSTGFIYGTLRGWNLEERGAVCDGGGIAQGRAGGARTRVGGASQTAGSEN